MSEIPRRIGLLVPASDPVVEADFHRFLPPGITFHTARLHQAPQSACATVETLTALADAAPPAAASVALVEPELIVFACTSGSLFKGFGWDVELARRIAAASGGVPATTTATSMVAAHKALGMKRVVMVTPYPEETNRIEVKFLAEHGIEVAEYASFNCRKSRDIGFVAPSAIREMVLQRKAAVGRVDGLFVSCTALRVMGLVEDLERELGKPVVTSNQATVWMALRLLGADGGRVPAGRLFRTAAPAGTARAAE
jgi:maleate cis-trans isomerase